MKNKDPSNGGNATASAGSSSFFQILDIFCEQWLDQVGAFTPEHLSAPIDDLSRTCPNSSDMLTTAGLLNQACLHWMAAGMRSNGRIVQAVTQCQARFVDHVARSAAGSADKEETLRLLVDDARACLRQIAEASEREAKAFRSDLEALDEALRALADEQTEPDKAGRRRWKVKP